MVPPTGLRGYKEPVVNTTKSMKYTRKKNFKKKQNNNSLLSKNEVRLKQMKIESNFRNRRVFNFVHTRYKTEFVKLCLDFTSIIRSTIYSVIKPQQIVGLFFENRFLSPDVPRRLIHI